MDSIKGAKLLREIIAKNREESPEATVQSADREPHALPHAGEDEESVVARVLRWATPPATD